VSPYNLRSNNHPTFKPSNKNNVDPFRFQHALPKTPKELLQITMDDKPHPDSLDIAKPGRLDEGYRKPPAPGWTELATTVGSLRGYSRSNGSANVGHRTSIAEAIPGNAIRIRAYVSKGRSCGSMGKKWTHGSCERLPDLHLPRIEGNHQTDHGSRGAETIPGNAGGPHAWRSCLPRRS